MVFSYKTMILLLVFACFITYNIECRGGGRGGRGGSRGRSGMRRSYRYSSYNNRYQRITTPKSNSGISKSDGTHSHAEAVGYSGNNFITRLIYNGPYTYHNAPQSVYIKRYRSTNSRYSDILRGLTLYNLGRSHNHYNHRYYEDDFYRKRYNSSSEDHHSLYAVPGEKAECSLKITRQGVEQKLSIPCEIVSTFADYGEELDVKTNVVVCENVRFLRNFTVSPNSTILNITWTALPNVSLGNDIKSLSTQSITPFNKGALSTTKELSATSQTSDNVTTPSDEAQYSISTSNFSTYTICTSAILINSVNPLTQKGPRIRVTSRMKCAVEIQTPSTLKRNKVECKMLEKYFKMPEPVEESYLTPNRYNLKSWMESPPWWLSLFIAL